MIFKTIELGHRGIDFENISEEKINKIISNAEAQGIELDFDNDLILHRELGAFVCNFPIEKSKEPTEELLREFHELIGQGCHLVLGNPYNATMSRDGSMKLYGVYCTNYRAFVAREKAKVRTK